nr:hypothetical protein [Tanacetum cinerariifolium]
DKGVIPPNQRILIFARKKLEDYHHYQISLSASSYPLCEC